MTKNKNRYGLFYVSNGKWVGPYCGVTFTKRNLNRNPIKEDIKYFKNRVLKSRVAICPVQG